MCMGGSPQMPAPPPPAPPPAPPPKIEVKAAPVFAQMPELKNEQARPDNPYRKKRARKTARGKGMLKIPMNASGGSVNA